MKGSDKVIAKLNALLASEHAAIVQYATHAAMVKNWGYSNEAYIKKNEPGRTRSGTHGQNLVSRRCSVVC
jgi:bacterioferritin (cytochrome b1)